MSNDPPLRTLQPGPQPRVFKDIRITKVAHVPKRGRMITGRFNYHAVFVIIAGRGQFTIDDKPPQEVVPGSMFSIWPGPTFSFGPVEDGHWNEFHVCLHGKGLSRWRDLGLIPSDGQVHGITSPASVRAKFRRLMRLQQSNVPYGLDRMVVQTENLLLDLFYERAEEVGFRQLDSNLDRIMQYCRDNCTESIDFQALADRFDMSYSSLRQKLRDLTGLPPHKYLISLRCKRAQQLLSNKALAVGDIAEEVGFSDAFTFSRVFKRQVGLSPSDWRKSLLGEGT